MGRLTSTLSYFLDRMARWVVVVLMALVVSNVIMRFMGRPIQGTIEFVEVLTAMVIGLSLAHCAAQDGHIAVTFLLEKLSAKIQAFIDVIVGSVVFLFLSLIVWRLCIYANTVRITGQVSLTTKTSYYPFIFVIAFGFLVYCLVVLTGLIDSVRKVVRR
ncbi:MAG: TRAP transporter small permease [Dethiobacter sp.]|jgi:TRAP-type C4-dicarboxylate transport system permease small subunit|nr:MAG: TRAP transporter small permease [Dethiobacter sp.]